MKELLSIMSSRGFLYYLMYGPILALMYYSAYSWLIGNDWAREDYNYCYLIPFVVMYVAWEKRARWKAERSEPSWTGLFVVIAGVLLYIFGELAGEFFTLYLSSWIIVTGLLFLHAGWRKLRTMAFPVALSLFLFPLPYFLNTKLTFGLKLISSEIGVKMIQLFGMSAYREGNVIDLGFTQLQVVDACSGLRYLIPLFLMGILMAYFYRAALWKKIVVAVSTIPLSIITNSLRIAMTALLFPAMGRAAAEGFFHDFSGWVIFVVSLGTLLAEIALLRRIIPRPDEGFMLNSGAGSVSRSMRAETESPSGESPTSAAGQAIMLRPQFVIASIALAAALGVTSVVDSVDHPPATRSFAMFPATIGDWEGKRLFMDQKFIDELDFTDYVQINYSNSHSSLPVDFYVAYYASQTKGKSVHSPETCLPGGGWVFRDAGVFTVPLKGMSDRPLTVTRAIMEKGGSRQVVYFWFNQRGRILTNAYEVKLYNVWDSLFMKRTNGALVRLISPVGSAEKVADADLRLQSFMAEMMPVLKDYIPE